MKQSPEIQRQLLFDIEDCDRLSGLAFANKAAARAAMIPEEMLDDCQELTKDIEYNLGLLVERGLIKVEPDNQFIRYNLTAIGHDSIEAIRDDTFWNNLRNVTPREASVLLRNTVGSAAANAAIKMLGYE